GTGPTGARASRRGWKSRPWSRPRSRSGTAGRAWSRASKMSGCPGRSGRLGGASNPGVLECATGVGVARVGGQHRLKGCAGLVAVPQLAERHALKQEGLDVVAAALDRLGERLERPIEVAAAALPEGLERVALGPLGGHRNDAAGAQ